MSKQPISMRELTESIYGRNSVSESILIECEASDLFSDLEDLSIYETEYNTACDCGTSLGHKRQELILS